MKKKPHRRTDLISQPIIKTPIAAAVVMAVGGQVGLAQESGGLEEIVVTAQKRSENLQDVPISIEALGTEKLEELNIRNFNDYVRMLPSVASTPSIGAGAGFSAVYMRGIVTGGDICKCLACGADAVMIGSPIARAAEAPGRGFHWGMATPSPVLPRGTRIKVGTTGSLEKILRGPASLDDGTQNLLGCIRTSMGTLGARTLKEMQQVEVVVAPSLLTEGKVYQKAQQLGMGK